MSTISKKIFFILVCILICFQQSNGQVHGCKNVCVGNQTNYHTDCGACFCGSQISVSGVEGVDYRFVCVDGCEVLWLRPGLFEVTLKCYGAITGIVYFTDHANVTVYDCVEGFNCESNPITISSIPYDGHYSSTDLVSSTALVINRDVEFTSEVMVELNPGFMAENSNFQAYISGCTRQCTTLKSGTEDKSASNISEIPRPLSYSKEDSIYEVTGIRPPNYSKPKINEESKTIQIFPNPSTGIFNINLPKSSNKYDIAIYNQLGVRVFSNIFYSQKQIDLNLTNQQKGIYTIIIISDDSAFSSKIVIE